MESDSIVSFFKLLLQDPALPRSTVQWVAYAFTKQLALEDVRSVIPVSKEEDSTSSQRPLPPLLSLLLDTIRPDETALLGCRLMLLVVKESLSSQSLNLASFLSTNHLTLEPCLQYIREEAAALQEPVESMESIQSMQSTQPPQRDIRAWQWGVSWCIGVLGGVPDTVAVNVLAFVRLPPFSHPQLESQCGVSDASPESSTRLRLSHTLRLLVSLVTQTQLLLDSSTSESFFASTMGLKDTRLMNAMLMSGLECRDAYFLSQVPLILSKNGSPSPAASLLVRLIIERPNDKRQAVACLTMLEEGLLSASF